MIVVAQAIYVSELFPTEYRMRGVGICSAVGRFTSAFVQFIVVAIFTAGGVNAVVGSVTALLLFQAIIVGIFGIETKRKRLEDIAPEPLIA
jgi:putative MFS transporter